MLKKILLTLLVAISSIGVQAQAVKGEKSLGPKIGYISRNTSVVAGLVFQYSFSDHLRISPEMSCAFRHHNQDAFLADINMHFPFSLSEKGKAGLYPLAGLAFNSWNNHSYDPVDDADVTSHVNRIGLNAGAGFDLRCSRTLKLNLEAKYTLLKAYSSVIITLGISYIF